MTSSNSSPIVRETFAVTVKAYGEDGALFLTASTITLSAGSTVYGDISGITSGGQANFNIYFSDEGTQYVQATSGAISNSIIITVLQSSNADIECQVPIDETTCQVCVPNAQLFDGKCDCTLNSQYNIVSRSCDCDTGLIASNNYCIACANYFKSSEITGKFSTDFKKITFVFARKPVTPDICSTYLIFQSTLSDAVYKCIWSNSYTLVLTFEKVPLVSGLVIGIDPLLVQVEGGECGFAIQQLNIDIKTSIDVPVPIAGINAPSSFSLLCARNDLRITATSNGANYVYTWNAVISPTNNDLLSMITSSVGTSIVLPLNSLSVGSITLTLTVSNSAFGTSDSSSKVIQITSGPFLLVSLTSGSDFTSKVTDPLSISAFISEGCGGSTYTYTWTYLSTNTLNFASILENSQSANNLFIRPKTLTAGLDYSFQVAVKDDLGATGSSIVTVHVKESPIEMVLNRGSGQIGTSMDLVIKVKANDPDNSQSTFTYKWECSESNSDCVDNSGVVLFNNQNTDILTIPQAKLRNNAVYSFSVSASTSTKSSTISLETTVISGLTNAIMIENSLAKVNTNTINTIIPIVSNIGSATFQWKLIQGDLIAILPTASSSNSFISLPMNYLNAGVFYKLGLYMTDTATLSTTTAFYSFNTNVGPSCDGLVIVKSNSLWTFEAVNCVDGDEADYPLTYQYGVGGPDGNDRWVTSKLLVPEFIGLIPSSSVKTAVKVCDSLGSCQVYYGTTTGSRRLSSVLTDFKDYTNVYENIPNGVLYYASLADAADIEYIYQTMQGYFNEQFFDSAMLDLYLDCLNAVYLSEVFASTGLVDDSIKLTINVLNAYDNDLDNSKFQKVLENVDIVVKSAGTGKTKTLLQTAASQWENSKIPGTEYTFGNNLLTAVTRVKSESLQSYEFSKSWLKLFFPSDLDIETDSIYDILFYKYYNGDFEVYDLSLNKSGEYSSYTLEFTSPVTLEILLKSSVKMEFTNNYDTSDLQCLPFSVLNWTLESCQITQIGAEKTYINLHSFPLIFELEITKNNSGLEVLCQFIIYAIAGAGIIIVTIVYFRDRQSDYEEAEKNLVELFPISSLMVPQAKPWRFLLVLQLVTSETLLLSMLGGFYYYFYPNSAYNLKEIFKSGMVLCLAQAFTISCTILNFSTLKKKGSHALPITICLIFYCASLAGIILIQLLAPSKVSIIWLTSFALWLVADAVVLQFIYALLMKTRKQPMKGGVTTYVPRQDMTDLSINKMFENPIAKKRNESEDELILPGANPFRVRAFTVKEPVRNAEIPRFKTENN